MSEDQQRLRYLALSPDGTGAMRTVEHYLNAESGLETVLLEMVRLRCSQLNRCSFCISMHGYELRQRNEPTSRIEAVERWRESDAFTARERAALRWAEVLTDLSQGHADEEEFAAVRLHFNDKELVDLSIAIASINAWNRMGVAFRPQWREPGLRAAAGAKVASTAQAATPVPEGVGD